LKEYYDEKSYLNFIKTLLILYEKSTFLN